MDDPVVLGTASLVGALSAAAIFTYQGQWKKGLGLTPGGTAMGYYAGPTVALWAVLPIPLASFLLGLLSMAFTVKVLETWDHFDLGSILNRFLVKLLRL